MDTVEERRGHRRAVSIAPDAHHSAGQGGDEMGGGLAGSMPLLGLHGQGVWCAFLRGMDLLYYK